MKDAIVIDIGGTFLRYAIYRDGELLDLNRTKSPNFIHYPDANLGQLQSVFIDTIEQVIHQTNENGYTCSQVGISFPGPVLDGRVLGAPTMWGEMHDSFELLNALAIRLPNHTFTILNDITAAGWRYLNKTDGNFCIITISSGVGNKVFWNKEVLLGKGALGGEIGHSYYGGEFSDVPCDCGQNGHLGAISSGRGIEKIVSIIKKKYPEAFLQSMLNNTNKVTTHEIVEALRHNDEFSILLLEESIKPLAKSINSIVCSIGIQKFILIGGFALAVGPLYIDTLVKALREIGLFGIHTDDIETMVELGENDDNHCLLGMGHYMFHNSNLKVEYKDLLA
jgi:predicted NBD/HSP70 family sugar kinase